MSSENEFRPQPVDPYRDLVPSHASIASGPAATPAFNQTSFQKIPTGLSAVAILYTVFGVLGIIGFFFGILGLIFMAVVDPATFQNAASDSRLNQFQQEMNTVGRDLMWLSIPLTLLNLVVSGLLLISGIGLLRRNLWAARMGSNAGRLGIVTELLRLVSTGIMSYYQFQLYNRLTSSLGGTDEEGYIILGIVVVTLVIGVGYAILKIVMYLVCGGYLRSGKATPYLTT